MHEPCGPLLAITGHMSGREEVLETLEVLGAEISAQATGAVGCLQQEAALNLPAVKRGDISTEQAIRTGRAAASVLGASACRQCIAYERCPVQKQLDAAAAIGGVALRKEQREKEQLAAAKAARESTSAKPSFADRSELATTSPEMAARIDRARTRIIDIYHEHTSPASGKSRVPINVAGKMVQPGSSSYWKQMGEQAKSETRLVYEDASSGEDQKAEVQLQELSFAVTHALHAQHRLDQIRKNKGHQHNSLAETRSLKEEMSHISSLVQAVGEHYNFGPVALVHHLENIVNITIDEVGVKIFASEYIWQILRGAMAESACRQLLAELYDKKEIQDYHHASPEVDVADGYDYAVTLLDGSVLRLDVKASKERVGTVEGYNVDPRSGKVTIYPQISIYDMQTKFNLSPGMRRNCAQMLKNKLYEAKDRVVNVA